MDVQAQQYQEGGLYFHDESSNLCCATLHGVPAETATAWLEVSVKSVAPL